MPKSLKYWKIGAEIVTKLLKIQGCVADAFFYGFGAALGRQKATQGVYNALSQTPFWEPFSIKNLKNGIQKGIQKSMPKKYPKMMPKGSQNDAKMDAKIDDFSIFYEFVIFWKSSFSFRN